MDLSQVLQLAILGLSLGSIYALIALGYTLVYGVLQLINFAHGDIIMVGAFLGYFLAKTAWLGSLPVPWRFVLMFLASMSFCALLGVTIERFAYRPLRQQPRLAALITAIGVSLFLEYGGQVVFGATPRQDIPLWVVKESPLLHWHSLQITDKQLFQFGVAALLMVALQIFVSKTLLGKAMRAVSRDMTAAHLVGVNVNRVVTITFAIGSALAAAAGIMQAMSYPKIDPLMGLLPGVKAFVAAVLGGIGNIPGAMAGGLVLGMAETFVGYFGSSYRDAFAFSVLILILLFKPTGIFGRETSDKA